MWERSCKVLIGFSALLLLFCIWIMKNSGWIKLHRKMRDNPYMRKPAYRAIWVELLFEAEFQEGKSAIINGKQYYLKSGEFTCGLKQLSQWTGVAKGTCERIIKTFENETMIETQKTNKFTLYKIVNWMQYQNIETQNETPVRLHRDSSETQMRTPQEVKKEIIKEIKKENVPLGELEDLFISFKEQRRRIKKPMTELAEELMRKKIIKMREKYGLSVTKSQIETSIVSNWSDIYDPKPTTNKSSNGNQRATHPIQRREELAPHEQPLRIDPTGKKSHELIDNPWLLAKQEAMRATKQIP